MRKKKTDSSVGFFCMKDKILDLTQKENLL